MSIDTGNETINYEKVLVNERSITGKGVQNFFHLSGCTNEYELDYYNGRNAINSFTHYLIELYGEDAISNLMLFPETVLEVTGKDWIDLEAEWKTHIKNKFKGVKIPEWISSQ